MSGLDLKAVHEALADQIRAGIADAGKFTVQPFPSTSARPVIEVWPDTDYITYVETFGARGVSTIRLVVRVLLSNANAETEWLAACRLLSAGTGFTSSITDAVMADKTLGGAVATVQIGNASWTPDEAAVDIPIDVHLNKIGAQV